MSMADEAYAEAARGLKLDVSMVPTEERRPGGPTWRVGVAGVAVSYGNSPREAGEALRRWMIDQRADSRGR